MAVQKDAIVAFSAVGVRRYSMMLLRRNQRRPSHPDAMMAWGTTLLSKHVEA